MQRKELNIFSISFLDLLSGALGAVLILFIIIPKMTSEQQSALEEMEKLNVQTAELLELFDQVRNSIPVELYERIQAQMSNTQSAVDELTQTARNLRQRLDDAESENAQLRRHSEQIREQLSQAQRQLDAERRQNRNAAGDKLFGVNAQLGIVCIWPENIDVDLYVQDLSTGEVGYFNNKATPFGVLLEDITFRDSVRDVDRYELFYQSRIVPGQYLIYVNIYARAPLTYADSATVDGHVVMFPGASNEKKINFRRIRLTRRGETEVVGTLTVTGNDITLKQ